MNCRAVPSRVKTTYKPSQLLVYRVIILGMQVLAILSLKGGVGKTTTAMHLATVAAQSRSTCLVDADPEQSALRWAGHAGLPFEVVAGEPQRLARQLKAFGHRTVIIDTPPNSRELLLRAGGLAHKVVVPVAPTGLEVDRLRPTLELLADLQAQREELDVAILLTRFRSRRKLAQEAVEALEGLPVLSARVRELEAYKSAFGAVPHLLDEYWAVWQELQR